MKWFALLPVALLLTSCCCTRPDGIAYQQVVVTPCCNQIVTTAPCSRCYKQVTIINQEEPIDVTTTMIDYY